MNMKWAENSKWRKRRNKLLNTITLPNEGSVLDLSCGDGQFLELVHLQKPNLKFVGVDISEEDINKAVADYGWASFAVSAADHLNFLGNTFDAVFCNMALHHYVKPAEVLEEIARVLKPGGRLYILDEFPRNFLTQLIYNLKGCDADYHFEKYYRNNEIKKILGPNLTLKRTSKLSFFPRLQVLEIYKLKSSGPKK
jgi:ubiquinone/menaquinone biosynthesis C-methylase UbiE